MDICMDFEEQFIIIDTLFMNYTIVIDVSNRVTSVWCEHCNEWVVDYEGDAISDYNSMELYEKIINDHTETLK